MPLDHYVSQVHLKNFHSPKLGEMLYAMRKPDMKAFPCRTKDVCRIEEGSTNDYLTEPRAIGLAEIRDINKLIVRSAESLVFYRDDHDWVPRFIERHRRYRVESAVKRIPTEKREIVWTHLELREQKPAK